MADSPEKNTADITPPKSTFARIKDDTKQVVNKLLGFFRQNETVGEVTVKSPTTKILQGIHKLLVEQEAQRKTDFQEDKKRGVQEERENEKRHREILKVLLGIPTPQPPEVEIKEEEGKEETKEKPKKKPKGKKPTARKVPKKPTAKKAAPKKPKPKKPAATKAKPPAAPRPSAAKVITGAAVAGVGLLPLLAKAESPDYNQLVFPKKNTGAPSTAPLTGMTIKEVLSYQDQMIKSGNYPSSAVGKYQIIKNTLEGGVRDLKLNLNDKFDEKTQDRLYFEYLTGSKRKNLDAYLTGKSDNLEMAQMDMAMEFASFGVPRDVKANEFGKGAPARDIKRGQSFYAGDGANRASVTPEQSATSLSQERDVRMGKKVEPVPPVANAGARVDKASTEVKQMKAEMSDQNPTNRVVNNVNVDEQQQTKSKPKLVDDRSPMERKLQNG